MVVWKVASQGFEASTRERVAK